MLSGEGYFVPLGLDAPQLHTRVSVGQLRSALLQQTGSRAQPDKLYAHLHVCVIPLILCTSVTMFDLASTFSFPFLLLLCLCGY